MKAPKLIGKNIYLRKLSLDVLEDMHEYSRIEEFYAYMEFSPHKSVKETKVYLQKLIDREKNRNSDRK